MTNPAVIADAADNQCKAQIQEAGVQRIQLEASGGKPQQTAKSGEGLSMVSNMGAWKMIVDLGNPLPLLST